MARSGSEGAARTKGPGTRGTKNAKATKDRVVTFRPDDDLLTAMEELRERDGVPFSQQIRRALRTWLEAKDMLTARDKRTLRTRPRGLPSWRRRE